MVNFQSHGASQPVAEDALECVGIRVVSFNFGIPQTMLDDSRTWKQTHSHRFCEVLESLGTACGSDFVFGSEAGDAQKGFQATSLDFTKLVANALPGADCSTSGAYFHVWNVNKALAGAFLLASGNWRCPMGPGVDVYWQAFDLTYRDASKLAGKDRDASKLAGKVGLVVGNLHIPVGGKKSISEDTRKSILKRTLTFLTKFQLDEWTHRKNFTVVRLLVGDCNLKKEVAEKVSQLDIEPRQSRMQRECALFPWKVVSTDDALVGDVMFVQGAFAEERCIPIGPSFEMNGMGRNQNDAVSAQLMIPVGRDSSGGAPLAAGGAPQPAKAALATKQGTAAILATCQCKARGAPPLLKAARKVAEASGAPPLVGSVRAEAKPCAAGEPSPPTRPPTDAERAAAGGAFQPAKVERPAADEPSPRSPSSYSSYSSSYSFAAADRSSPRSSSSYYSYSSSYSFSPDWSSDNEAASKLHEELKEVEDADDMKPEVQAELASILFQKKTVTTGGFARQYVASRAETIRTIQKLLTRRKKFMEARNLRDGDSEHRARRYLFTHNDRKQLMDEWKTEFHARQDQIQQQKRDSWKPHGRPDNGGEWGSNNVAVRKGKHSRFGRHLQLEAGSKTMAELIIYAGRYDPQFLKSAEKAKISSGAFQPAPGTAVHRQLKRAAETAKLNFRNTCALRRRVEKGDIDLRNLGLEAQWNLRALENGSLLATRNYAIAAYGHGTLRNDRVDQTLHIGGSTGGISRLVLDGQAAPDVDSFLMRR